jgi:hypothetical protein
MQDRKSLLSRHGMWLIHAVRLGLAKSRFNVVFQPHPQQKFSPAAGGNQHSFHRS